MNRRRRRMRGGLAWYAQPSVALNGVLPSLIHDYKNGLYYNSTTGATAFPFTATRTTNATMFNAQGNMVWAPTNNLNNSEAVWSTLSVATSSLQAIASPTGAAVYKLVADTGVVLTGNDGLGNVTTGAVTVVAGQTFCFAFYAKAAEVSVCRIREATASGYRATIDLITGIITTEFGTSSLTAGMVVTSQNVGDGWFRIIARRTVAGTTQVFTIKQGGATGDGVSGVYLSSINCTPNDVATPQPFVATTGSAYYGPRIGYDFSNSLFGLMKEEARTNNITKGAMLVTGDISGNAATVATGASYFGGWSSVRATADGSLAGHFATAVPVTPAALEVRSVAAVIRPISGTLFQLAMSANFAAIDCYANFNLSLGTATANGAGASSIFIRPLSGGAYHVGFTYTSSAAPASGAGAVIANLVTGLETRIPSVTSSDSCDIVFAMNGAGTGWSSIIPTFGVAATRGADSVKLTVGSWYNQTQGTLYARFTPCNGPDSTRRAVSVNDGSSNNSISICYSISNTLQMRSAVAGVADFTPSTVATSPVFSPAKGVVRLLSPEKRLSMNGSTVAVGSAALPISGITTLGIMEEGGGSAGVNGYIHEVRYYPVANASDAQLQALTT